MNNTVKETLLVLATLVMLGCTTFGDTRRSPRNLMLIGRDYNLWEDVSNHPVDCGINSWYNKELGSMPAIYASAAMLSYKDIIRFEAGGTTTWNHNTGYPEIAFLTGISTLIEDRIVIGIWMAPFWNLHPIYNDDPWGIMIGYAW